jgi:hypothetical protein
MKHIIKHLFFATLLAGIVAGCDKKDDLAFYKTGNAPALSSSTDNLAATPADSSNPVITFSWTTPNYATDSSTVKYILELDSAGRDFSKAFRRVVIGKLSTTFTGKQINDILIGYGFTIGTAYDMDVRLISSYGNNNDQYISSTLNMKMTPYKIPPKIPVPANLIMVGDATVGGWSNPASPAEQATAQTFSKIDETTYGGIFFLNGGGQYLMLPVSGNWDHKYGGTSKTGGDLLVDGAVPGSNTPAPDNDGWYKIIVDFQTGKYTVTEFIQQHGLPNQLVAVGGATDIGWTNEVSNPQKFTRLNSTEFTLTTNLKKDDAYLILPEPGNWDKKYGVEDKSVPAAKLGGKLVPQGQDIPSPSEAGSYKIDVNFATGLYKVTKQ